MTSVHGLEVDGWELSRKKKVAEMPIFGFFDTCPYGQVMFETGEFISHEENIKYCSGGFRQCYYIFPLL